jgi:hypothetical protein
VAEVARCRRLLPVAVGLIIRWTLVRIQAGPSEGPALEAYDGVARGIVAGSRAHAQPNVCLGAVAPGKRFVPAQSSLMRRTATALTVALGAAATA